MNPLLFIIWKCSYYPKVPEWHLFPYHSYHCILYLHITPYTGICFLFSISAMFKNNKLLSCSVLVYYCFLCFIASIIRFTFFILSSIISTSTIRVWGKYEFEKLYSSSMGISLSSYYFVVRNPQQICKGCIRLFLDIY